MNEITYNIPKQDIDETTELSPYAHRTMAHAYLCSAEALIKQFGFNTQMNCINCSINPSAEEEQRYDILLNPSPFFYLLQHSLELYLKGYLNYENISHKKGKQGHSLTSLANACSGLEFTGLEIHSIAIFDSLSDGGGEYTYILRYIAPGNFTYPNIKTTIELLHKMDEILLSKERKNIA